MEVAYDIPATQGQHSSLRGDISQEDSSNSASSSEEGSSGNHGYSYIVHNNHHQEELKPSVHRYPVISTVQQNFIPLQNFTSGMVVSHGYNTTPVTATNTIPISVITSTRVQTPPPTHHEAALSPLYYPANSSVFRSAKKKRAQPIPEDRKDDAYWEKRKRNNESAKRSRELRRQKERETSKRVRQLEEENLRLKAEVDVLKSELESMRQIMCKSSAR